MATIRMKRPHMKGAYVERYQRALRNSKLAKFLGRSDGFAPGPVDGEAGPKTLSGIRRARWWCGYKTWNRRIGGKRLLLLLEGKRELTAAEKRRRKARIEARPQESLREKAYKIALSQLGEHEGAYNVCKFTRWWFRARSWAVGWCSIFASWCYWKAGSKVFRPCTFIAGVFKREGYSDYSEQMLADAIAGRNGLSAVERPERGDLVIWQWDTGSTDHTSILESATSSTVVSIDGNVPNLVKRCSRSRSRVRAFIRVTK